MQNEDEFKYDFKDEFVPVAVALKVIPEATFALLTALLLGLVRRNILSAEDARDILSNAKKNVSSGANVLSNEQVKAGVIAGATDLLTWLSENPVVRAETGL